MVRGRLADNALAVESFAGRRDTVPPEFADLAGLLHVKVCVGRFPLFC
jgi:hypothetical protein